MTEYKTPDFQSVSKEVTDALATLRRHGLNLNLNEDLQKQVDEITINLKITDNEVNADSYSNEVRQIDSLIKLIFSKYQDGRSVKNEILLLEDLLQPNKEEIFEKISLLELKKFYGFKYLE